MLRTLEFIVLVLLCFKYSKACNGYTVTLNYARVCNADSVFKPVGITASLDKDCNVVLNGCLDMTKPIKIAKGTYVLSKPPLPDISGDIDFCELFENPGPIPQANEMVDLFGLPRSCPVESKKYCISPKNNKINISAFKKKLSMAVGTTTVKIDTSHDTGKTCIEFSFTMHKPRRG